jgi:hypothetical protein
LDTAVFDDKNNQLNTCEFKFEERLNNIVKDKRSAWYITDKWGAKKNEWVTSKQVFSKPVKTYNIIINISSASYWILKN